MKRMPRNAPALLLAAALVAAGAMALILTRELTFLQDTWEYLMNRRDPSAEALFHPHNEHLVLFPVLIEEALLRLFGMTSATPEYVVLIGFLLGTALLLYVYVKRRVGPWPALLATIAILCLGPAWEVLLWPFEISFVGPVFFGIAMLLALEREDALGDLAACLFLIAALGFSGLGIPFLAAAVVAIAVGRRDRWLVRAYIVVVPVALYAVWYLQWGHEAQTQLSAHNVLNSPQVVAEAISVAVGSLVGLAATPVGGSITPLWGALVLVALIVALAYRQLRVRPGIARGLWPVAAAAAAFWILLAFNQSPGRDASASRYQYGGAIFVVLILANLLQGVRPGRRVLLFAATVTAVGVALNLVVLHQGRNALLQQAVLTRADTAAIEIARRSVDPEFQLNPELAGTPTLVDVFAGKYFQAVDEYGSPAYSPAELATAPEPGRRQADIVLGQALPISTDTSLGAYDAAAGAGCAEAGGGALSELPVSAGLTRIELAPGPHASFSLRRFAVGEYPVVTEGALGGSVTILRIPRDTLARPWHLLVEASQAARVCAGPG